MSMGVRFFSQKRTSCGLQSGDDVTVVCPKAKSIGMRGIVLDPCAQTKQGERVKVAMIKVAMMGPQESSCTWWKTVRYYSRYALQYNGSLSGR